MAKKDRNDELNELKEQMEALKQQLHENEIDEESRAKELVHGFGPKHRRWMMVLGALSGLFIVSPWILDIIEKYERWSWWAIALVGLLVLFMIFEKAVQYAGFSYTIKDEQLIVRDVLQFKMAEIPINKIRYIEFMANKGQGARIVYNKIDDFYLRRVNYVELIKNILKINPDIEIRKELA